MAQKTNLNISPYYDDFSEKDFGARDKNYYKLLFNPGRPIQTRELNTLQSILQNQVETFGSHIFKEGSLVIPGNITFDNQFYAVKLNEKQYGVDVESYLNQFIGKKITGQISGVTATIQYVQFTNSEVEYPTIYVKYLNSDSNFEINPFQDGESLFSDETVGTIPTGTPFGTTISSSSSATGSAASIGEGVYFVRGTFVKVHKQTIILDYYTNTPSYRVGLRVDEEIITAKEDPTLYDNAKGFTNYAAPGADRFKISLVLVKKLLTDTNDTDFIEILRTTNGGIQKLENRTNYSIIRDYLAQRTYDESGDYSVVPFKFSLNNSLNNRLGNDGIFFDTEKTNQGNTPSDDLLCVKISPGKAYVRGYDIEKTGVEIIDLPKPRTTQSVSSVNVPFEMGNLLRVNNVTGAIKQRQIVYLQNRRKNSNIVSAGTTIGSARVYNFNLTDAAYSGVDTNWDLYLYDIQTYTEITLNQSISSQQLPTSSYIKGKSSGAIGYAVYAGNNSTIITVNQTSGRFSNGEQITINGLDNYPRTIKSIKIYSTEDIKSIYQPTSISGFTTSFLSDTQLNRIARPEIITISANSGGISTATVASPSTFSGIRSDTVIRYQIAGLSTETYNRVVSVSPGLNSLTLESLTSVSDVCSGSLPTSQFSGPFSLGVPTIRNEENGFLYSELPNSNVASVNLSSSTISFSAQSNTTFTPTGNALTVNLGDFNLGINSTSAKFEAFDEERYSIFYTNGTIENLTSDKVSLSGNSEQVTFSNLSSNNQISVINATFVKNGIQSKSKKFTKSKSINITYSKNPESGTGINTSVNDGLVYNQYYGLRVQDEEISLNYPDVTNIVCVYESLNTSPPILDKLTFSSIVNVDSNAIIGENIIGNSSNTVARVVSKPSANTLGVVYLNKNKFLSNESVTFEESNINTAISSIINGSYRDITSKFSLNNGQKEQYYDYSRMVRKSEESSPSRQLLIVFDHHIVPSGDNGDLFTANSYSREKSSSNIPFISSGVRCSDVLDFRPRVSVFSGSSSSPFDFSSRVFSNEPKIILSPNESTLIGYDFYLGRIDKLYLDQYGVFTVLQGIPSVDPKIPNKPDNAMEIATIALPPYLYDPKTAIISLADNRRYTMRDIGRIEDRVENLERVTSLSLLELNTQTLQIQDAQGLNRFKTGFFVDDFKNNNLINLNVSSIEIDTNNNELRPIVSTNSINLKPVSAENISDENIDLSSNFSLFDSNVQKSGDVITLKYESIEWISQNFATRVENVNPFNVISYSGIVKLTPENDSWVRTIRLEDLVVEDRTEVVRGPLPWSRVFVPAPPPPLRPRRLGGLFWWAPTPVFGFGGRGGRWEIVNNPLPPPTTSETSQEVVVSTGTELYMRSRNTGFVATNLKPLTRVYQFLDGNSGVDFIPKLIEISSDATLQNYGASAAFTVGETVVGSFNGSNLIKFRVAKSNHKKGPFDSPISFFTSNPYINSESIPENYSSSSKVLNVDITSLCSESQGLYSGYLTTGMKLVGQTSGAVSYVKDLRLISDINGFLSGSFFLRDPNTIPSPAVRIATGSKVFKLTSSATNTTPLPGSTLICSAEAIYKSEGTWEQRRRNITRITTITTYTDPLAQSFIVGGLTEEQNGNKLNEDANGVFLTAIDLFFASKDSNNAPLTVEVRTVELGTPTRTVLGNSVTLNPEDISVSGNASVPTKVTFDYPIYLEPGSEYAIVLLAPQSDQYEVWIAEMGEKTIETANLPDSQAERYSKQFAIGSLFKSQNGSIWTANQYQDMKFKLYKSKFVSRSGSVLFHNPKLDESNGYVTRLRQNPITILPRQISLGITTVFDSSLINILTTGRKITGSNQTYNYGYITGTGSSVSNVSITEGGFNYSTGTVETYNVSGGGNGLRLNITALNGVITNATVSGTYPGNGYSVGDVVGIVTSTVSPPTGNDARITISTIGSGIDRLYLSNCQGNSFSGSLNYYDNSGTLVSLASTTITSSTPVGSIYSGNFFRVNHFEHGMNSISNKVIISDVESDVEPTLLTQPVLLQQSTISVASTGNFTIFEGKVVDTNNPGYVKIDNEIIAYTNVGSGFLSISGRGEDSTLGATHDNGSLVYKYELGGVSLRRINTTHNLSSTDIGIDNYYVEFSRSLNGVNRSSDNSPANYPELSFTGEVSCGGEIVRATENIQFTSVNPHVSLLNPGSLTSVSSQIRTVSGTSVNGSESPFIDQGYEPIELGVENRLNSVRMVCSEVNEQEYLDSLLRNKSFTLKVDLETRDVNLSPMIFWRESSAEFFNNRLNSPITNYALDNRVNSLLDDPHSAIYVSNTVSLSQPATSLKVIMSAYRHSSADFRVLYALIRPDSSEVEPVFELFPGYKNLTIDNDQDGFLNVVDESKNDGLPDVFVPESLEGQFLEYEYTVNNLGQFTGYIIKIVMSGTDQSQPPRFKDLRSIALA
jgi:hypothetical protein